MTDRRRQLIVAFLIYLTFTLLMLAANVVNYVGERDGTLETMEPIAGMILGFVTIPVFAIALPLWLARRWGLEYSFWPRRKSWLVATYASLSMSGRAMRASRSCRAFSWSCRATYASARRRYASILLWVSTMRLQAVIACSDWSCAR